MNSKLICSIAGLSLLLTVIFLSGCTAIGASIGRNMDRAAKEKATKSVEKILPVKPGRIITVMYADSQEVTGIYQGYRQRSPSEYIPLYEDVRSNFPKMTLPLIGDTLLVIQRNRKALKASLVGFGLQRMWLKSPTAESLVSIPLSTIVKIENNDGAVFDSADPRTLFAENRMPSAISILIRRDSVDMDIPTDLISEVRGYANTHYETILACAGLVLDATVITVAIIGIKVAQDLKSFGKGYSE